MTGDEGPATTVIVRRARVLDYRTVVRCPTCHKFYDGTDPDAHAAHPEATA